jgi:hypothetical protein
MPHLVEAVLPLCAPCAQVAALRPGYIVSPLHRKLSRCKSGETGTQLAVLLLHAGCGASGAPRALLAWKWATVAEGACSSLCANVSERWCVAAEKVQHNSASIGFRQYPVPITQGLARLGVGPQVCRCSRP